MGQTHLKNVVFPIFAMHSFDSTDVQATKHLRAGVHPQLVPGREGKVSRGWGISPMLSLLSLPLPAPAPSLPPSTAIKYTALSTGPSCFAFQILPAFPSSGQVSPTPGGLSWQCQPTVTPPFPDLLWHVPSFIYTIQHITHSCLILLTGCLGLWVPSVWPDQRLPLGRALFLHLLIYGHLPLLTCLTWRSAPALQSQCLSSSSLRSTSSYNKVPPGQDRQ